MLDRDERAEALSDAEFEWQDDGRRSAARDTSRDPPARPLDFDGLLVARNQPDVPSLLQRSIDHDLQTHYSDRLTDRARHLLRDRQPVMSALSPSPVWMRFAFICLASAIPIGLIVAWQATLTALLSIVLFYCVLSMSLKIALTLAALMPQKTASHRATHRTPIVTIFLPVHKEGFALASLVQALERLDYPKDRLDLKFLVEEDDPLTRDTLATLDLNAPFETLVIPESQPQTKPKAMNYALPFARGEIIGIYDAEDAPEPDQIRKAVAALDAADDNTVCVQCRLNHYRATETSLSRMTSAEYTLWFDMLLNGLSRLRLPVPLGGTSLFIKAAAIREIDGWDPYNVTEDADLGLRLARKGWRAEVIESTTWEEPPVEFKQWCGQRSRWIKGFMVTWLVHMRSPLKLVRELGVRNALAINIMLMDGFVAFLLQPIFWLAIAWALVIGGVPWASLYEPGLTLAIALSFAIGQGFILLATFVAVRRRFGLGRALWSPFIWLYWQCATIPAYKALSEMFGRRFAWTKTEHGLSKEAKQRRDAALRER